MTELQLAL